MSTIKRILLYLHQLPQHMIGFGCYLYFEARGRIRLIRCLDIPSLTWCYYVKGLGAGFSLGKYVFLSDAHATNHPGKNERHEYGHSRQSRRLGWFYLPIIAVPSVLGNLYDRLFHRKWSNERSTRWYYNQPWERWADRLGGVVR